MTKTKMRVLLLAIPFLTAFSAGDVALCDCLPRGYRNHTPAGRVPRSYRNESWGYKVVIPEPLQGWDDSAGPHHGFGIEFGEPPESSIVVYGEANTLEFNSPVDAALYELSLLRRNAREIESVRIKRSRLGTLPAVEMVVTYTRPGSSERSVGVFAIALGPEKEPLYEVTLCCSGSRYVHDRRVFDQLLKSWRYTGY